VQGMMRCLSTLLFGTLLVLQTGGARLTVSSDTLPLIDDFDRVIQQRLSEPMPNAFGMSRIAVPSSFGKHFAPVTRNRRDFVPENDSERKAVAALESRKLAVGLYLFGELIVREDAAKFNSRALKGPGAITVHTPRPDWYPSARVAAMKEKDSASLPNWVKIYPVAQRAMRSFQDGGKGFEMEFEGWTIAARPAIATHDRCVSCHSNRALQGATAKRGEPIGGVLYAFRPVVTATANGRW